MKVLILCALLLLGSLAEASELLVKVHSPSHHSQSTNFSLALKNLAGKTELMVNDVSLPRERILSNHLELEVISTFQSVQKNCPRDEFTYMRIRNGKTESLMGCQHSPEGLKLFHAFEKISPLL